MNRALAGLALATVFVSLALLAAWAEPAWSEPEREAIRGLWLGSLPPVPPSPSNRVADSVPAAMLGKALFFDSRLSATGYVSCGTCHRPELGFQDGLPRAKGVALSNRRTPTLLGAAYNTWFFWDGRKDSLWAQALEPLESHREHGGHRYDLARTVAYHYADPYEAVFGPLPALDWTAGWEALTDAERQAVTTVFVNMGKAIEAYERTLMPAPARFDLFAAELLHSGSSNRLSPEEAAGLRLFLGKGKCVRCHTGPLFTDFEFHNTGVPAGDGSAPDPGWVEGLPLMLADEFGCKGAWSDAGPAGGCADRRYLVTGLDAQVGAFKTPTLRGVDGRPPYMHAGQLATLNEVLAHYRLAPPAPIGASELRPVEFTDSEAAQLLAFLLTLSE